MTDDKLQKIDKNKLPIFFRLLLSLPNVKLQSLPGIMQGMFWAVILPLFLGTEALVTFCLISFLPPPINLIATLAIPAVIFIAFVKIALDRFIVWWNGLVSCQTQQWNVSEKVTEYTELMEKPKND